MTNLTQLEQRLWDAADELRANSKLKASEYSVPVLGLIFRRFADFKFGLVEERLSKTQSTRRKVGKADYQAEGVLYLPPNARFNYFLNLAEGENIAVECDSIQGLPSRSAVLNESDRRPARRARAIAQLGTIGTR